MFGNKTMLPTVASPRRSVRSETAILVSAQLDCANFSPLASDAGPKNCRFREILIGTRSANSIRAQRPCAPHEMAGH